MEVEWRIDASNHRRVINGRIEVPDDELVEGMVVTILTPEDGGTFTLDPEAEPTLLPRLRKRTAAR